MVIHTFDKKNGIVVLTNKHAPEEKTAGACFLICVMVLFIFIVLNFNAKGIISRVMTPCYGQCKYILIS